MLLVRDGAPSSLLHKAPASEHTGDKWLHGEFGKSLLMDRGRTLPRGDRRKPRTGFRVSGWPPSRSPA
eukprot:scaffold95807_cov48-Phaeocystis_antarctica.AAC.2